MYSPIAIAHYPLDPDLPEALMDPFTLCLIEKPMLASDGYSYSFQAINTYIKSCRAKNLFPIISPTTRFPLTHLNLLPNLALEKIIEAYKKEKNNLFEKLPQLLTDPVTHKVLNMPVVTDDGQTYSAMNIINWFRSGQLTSPLTGLPLKDIFLSSNKAVQSLLDDYEKGYFTKPDYAKASKRQKQLYCSVRNKYSSNTARATAAAFGLF